MYYYTVQGINFEALSNDQQKEKMGNWLGFLKSVSDESELLITLTRKPIPLTIHGKKTERNVEQINIQCNEGISGILEAFYYDGSFEDGIPEQPFVDEKPNMIRREDGGLSKVYTLYDMPAHLPWGWAHTLISACSELRMWINPIEKEKAMSMMSKKRAILASSLTNRRSAQEHDAAVEITNQLIDNETRVFDMSMVCVVNGENKKELDDRCKAFERAARASGAQFDATPYKQGQLYYGESIRQRC